MSSISEHPNSLDARFTWKSSLWGAHDNVRVIRIVRVPRVGDYVSIGGKERKVRRVIWNVEGAYPYNAAVIIQCYS